VLRAATVAAQNVDAQFVELARSFRMGRWQTLRLATNY
jgi:ABC-type nitrate/sulfonate/bicarbonate transport system permease component